MYRLLLTVDCSLDLTLAVIVLVAQPVKFD